MSITYELRTICGNRTRAYAIKLPGVCVCVCALWKLGLEVATGCSAPLHVGTGASEPCRGQRCQCPIQILLVPVTSLHHGPDSSCLRILCSCWNRLSQSSQQARKVRKCLLGAALYLQLRGIGEWPSQPLPSGELCEASVPPRSPQ